ncbi:uncharacterized protein LOC115254010 [Aedes albopictus]|uniref:ARMC5-like ARM-repeats domain-containing protein n=1 Tax=Aedes albopictus TaxID=7160 RepID=A0ABM2A0H2_AEDAL|nr:uncharacterized protein LOC115254010 [Aedes albopictus]
MNRAQVANLLDEVRKSPDKGTVYRRLVRVRTEVINTEAGTQHFVALDGVRLLVGLLAKPHEKVLEVVLSILGNCCMRKECAKQAFEEGVLSPLISIIANIPNPAIQCRGCRLLGNLAQFPVITHAISKDNSNNTTYALTSILTDSNNTAVLIMSIRAVRQLWNEKLVRNLMIGQGCIKKIVDLLVKFARNEAKALESVESPAQGESLGEETEKVVIKRLHAPDRTITKEKFKNIVRHMENSHHCDIVGYQLIKSYRWKDSQDFKMPEAQETVELFTGILKCLQTITSTISAQVAEEMYGEQGCGIKCLVFLCSESSQFRTLALKIVSHLASNPDAIGKLTACDVITMASDLIMYANLDDSEKRYCTSVICLLAKEACNRGHIRRSGALQALMKLAKQCKEKHQLSIILYALYQYRFDNLSYEILLNNGLVSFLVGVLNNIIDEKEVHHIKHDDEETMNTSVFSKRKSSSQKAKLKRSDELFNFKSSSYYRHSKVAKIDPYGSAPESPESGSSGYASTSYNGVRNPSSSSSSPARTDEIDEFDEDDIYSPVCSDTEEDPETVVPNAAEMVPPEPDTVDDNTEDAKTSNEFDILAYLYDDNSNTNLMSATDLERDEEEPQTQQEARKRNHCSFDDTIDDNEIHDIELEIVSSKAFEKSPMQPILTLLWSISKSHKGLEFVHPGTLSTLLKICKLTKRPRGRAFQIIANIIKHVDHFLPLLKQDFVFRLHECKVPYSSHSRCWSCDEMKSACSELMTLFGNIGETGYGQGEIAHILRTGERTLQLQVSIIVMYVVRDTKLLHKLLYDMKILKTVMNIILNENDDEEEEVYEQRLSVAASSGLTTLAQNLCICGEEEDTGTPSEMLEAKEFDNTLTICNENSSEEKVTFKVTNASGVVDSVRVSKKLLIQGSDVFQRMFDGDHFIESKNNEVFLKENISVDGLKYFFYLIKLQTVNKLTGMAPPPKVIEASLDALSLSQKYLLPGVERSVQNIVKTLLNDDCVLNVFEWSLRNYNQELLVASTYYFLYSDISGAAKCKLFRAANKSVYRKEWRRLMYETILCRVQPNAE